MQRVKASVLGSLSVIERDGFQKSMYYVMIMMFLVAFVVVVLDVCSGNLHTNDTTVMLSQLD